MAQRSFFLVAENDPWISLTTETEAASKFVFLESKAGSRPSARFLVIADAGFSALIASPPNGKEDDPDPPGSEVIWTFEPNVVYSALEYLMARITAEFPERAAEFSRAVRYSIPKATSLQLTLSVTTKLAQILQAQAEREVAVNRIATAIRNAPELDCILKTAVTEVGRALNASSCGLRVEGTSSDGQTTKYYLRQSLGTGDLEESAMMEDLRTFTERLGIKPETYFVDGDSLDRENMPPRAVVPLTHQDQLIGLLLVRSDDPSRCWAENELLLLHTVADQVGVAINQAHLFAQLQEQALTDGLTGLYNRRAFEMQLDRDLQFATRMRQPLSLIMLDLDNLKQINDRLGHEGGDTALRMLADSLRAELRAVDTPARYGGDEFAIILPQADAAGALLVAERLRDRIGRVVLPGTSALTASVGLASFPEYASSREALCLLADRALYRAKRAGRNCVRGPEEDASTPAIFSIAEEALELQSIIN